MNYGKEIFNQLTTLAPTPVLWSWGASKFQTFKTGQIDGIGEEYLGGLVFYVRGNNHKGHVFITLAGSDTYTITLGHLKRGTVKPKKQVTDVYFDEMVDTIDGLVERIADYQY